MRIIAFSDSHRHHQNVHRLFEATHLTADLYIFLGDGESDLDNISILYPNKEILSVAGNCDFRSLSPKVGTTEVLGKKILFTHGDRYSVDYGLERLKSLAEQNGADIVLYGHIHERKCDYIDGVYYINPGSLGSPRDGLSPSFAAIDIIPAGVLCTHVGIDEI